jgi:PAS domain-containing protein
LAGSDIDYQVVFRALPGPLALLTPDGVVIDVNDSLVQASGRSRDQLCGRTLFEDFPANPEDPGSVAAAEIRESLESVLATGESSSLGPVRYDLEDPGRPGEFEERYWTIVHEPVFGEHGKVNMIVYRADEVTHVINQFRSISADHG